jgi:hypothetical protein
MEILGIGCETYQGGVTLNRLNPGAAE